MTEAITITKQETIRPDSVEIGTPGKGGVTKVYFDAGNLDDAKLRLRNAAEILKAARELLTNPEVKA